MIENFKLYENLQHLFLNVGKVSTGFEYFHSRFVPAPVLVELMVVLDAEFDSASNGITFRPGRRPSKGASLEKPPFWAPPGGFSPWDSPLHLCWLRRVSDGCVLGSVLLSLEVVHENSFATVKF